MGGPDRIVDVKISEDPQLSQTALEHRLEDWQPGVAYVAPAKSGCGAHGIEREVLLRDSGSRRHMQAATGKRQGLE